MEYAPERNQLIGVHSGSNPALYKTHVNLILGVVKLFEIVQRPFGREDFQFDTVTGKYLPVLLGRESEGAAVRYGGNRNDIRRCRT